MNKAAVIPRVALFVFIAAFLLVWMNALGETSGVCGENLVWTLDDEGLLTIAGTGEMESYRRQKQPWDRAGIRKIVIEEGVTGIGEYAFENCPMLGSVAFPDGIVSIGNGAFKNCSRLTGIDFPESLVTIGNEAFCDCSSIDRLRFSGRVESIGKEAFCELLELEEVELPEGLTAIGDSAFLGCRRLERISIPASVNSIGEGIFSYTDTINLVVIVSEGSAAEEYCRLNGLKAVYPGEEVDEPETELPPAFMERYPGYKGLYHLETGKGDEEVFLAKTPDGMLVLLCGTEGAESGWTIVESSPLPAESKVAMIDGLEMLDLGYAACTIRRYHDDVWGIGFTGFREVYFGPKWAGSSTYSAYNTFGFHPWGDITGMDWISLSNNYDEIMEKVDSSSYAEPYGRDRETRTPVFTGPDESSGVIAYLFNTAPLFVKEKTNEWTHVFLGPEDETQWSLDGWIRTENLSFGRSVDGKRPAEVDDGLFARNGSAVLETPLGSTVIEDYNRYDDIFEIGEMQKMGRDYWLIYFCDSEKIGFVLKESLRNGNG